MGVITKKYEFAIPVAASRMFKAMGDSKNNLLPTLLPEMIKSVEFVGDGGVGTIRTTCFADGSPVKYVKHKMDEIDEANNYCKFTMIEHDFKDDHLESIVHEVKLDAAPDGSSICKLSNHYHTKGDYVPKDEDIKAGEEQDKAIQVAIVKHLVANPALQRRIQGGGGWGGRPSITAGTRIHINGIHVNLPLPPAHNPVGPPAAPSLSQSGPLGAVAQTS